MHILNANLNELLKYDMKTWKLIFAISFKQLIYHVARGRLLVGATRLVNARVGLVSDIDHPCSDAPLISNNSDIRVTTNTGKILLIKVPYDPLTIKQPSFDK